MEGNGNLLQIREAARLAGCHPDSLRRYERSGIITSRRGPNGYRLFDPRDLAKLLGGGATRPRRVPLDRVHRRSFMENGLPSGCVDLVFFRPPTADARAGVHPDRFVAFIRPYIEEARRILTPKGSLIVCAKEAARRSRDLYLVDMLGIATGEIGLRFIDEFCWVRSHVAPARVGPDKMPDGWLRCLHLSPSSSPETHPEQVQRGDGNGKSVTVSPSNVFVLPPARGADRDEDTPVDLVRRFVRYCTRPGGIVCDPLAVPATPLAAMREGRRYICFQPNRARYHAIMASVAGEEEDVKRAAPVNPVNDLSPAEWMRFGASVWSVPKSAEERRITTEGEHPAVMPLELCTRLIRCLLPPTDEGPVLDPFCGLGSTLLAAKRLNKRSIGIEISEDYARLAGERAAREPASTARVDVHCADVRDVADLLEPGSVAMVLTSPPFWNVLDLKRTSDGRPVRTYRKAAASLASIPGYKSFVAALGRCFSGIEKVLRPGAPCVVEVMDLQRGPDFYPFHIDVCNAITRRTDLYLADAVVWDRTTDYNDQKPLGWAHRWFWRRTHSYILVFRKPG